MFTQPQSRPQLSIHTASENLPLANLRSTLLQSLGLEESEANDICNALLEELSFVMEARGYEIISDFQFGPAPEYPAPTRGSLSIPGVLNDLGVVNLPAALQTHFGVAFDDAEAIADNLSDDISEALRFAGWSVSE